MRRQAGLHTRRDALKSAAAATVLSTLVMTARDASAATATDSENKTNGGNDEMADVPLSFGKTVTVERRDEIVLIGLNRPGANNRIDPDTYDLLSKAYFDYEQDSSLRAAVLFGHGPNFTRGIDVDAFQDAVASGKFQLDKPERLDPIARFRARLSKPLVAVSHGDTWNLGHELCLAADIRIAAANANFGQDENTHGRFPGGGSTIRFVRDAGWGNAMRYMLTGDHWNAEEARRIGVVQEIAPTAADALALGIEIARKIAACAPLSIKTTLASAHLGIDASEAPALATLNSQYSGLFGRHDFTEARRAEAEGRAPVYSGD
jgi:enoyl-CoA hydratase